MTDRKKAPVEVIKVGYFLTEARTALSGETTPYDGSGLAYGYAYLTTAVNSVDAARTALARDLKNRQMLPSAGLYDIDQACAQVQELIGQDYVAPMRQRAVANLIGRGHQKLARMLSVLGYEPITDDDFRKHARAQGWPGGGGGR